MKLTITIDLDNAAFDSDPEMEVRRIFDSVVLPHHVTTSKLIDYKGCNLRDFHGDIVGWAVITR